MKPRGRFFLALAALLCSASFAQTSDPYRSIGGLYNGFNSGALKGTISAHPGELGQQPDPGELKALRTELEKMMEEDQKFRIRVEEVEKKYGPDSKEVEALWKEQAEIDNRLLKRL